MLVLIDLSEVSEAIGHHRQSVRRMIAEGIFPNSVPMFGRKPARTGTYFIQTEVAEWVQKRAIRNAVNKASGTGITGRPPGTKTRRLSRANTITTTTEETEQ